MQNGIRRAAHGNIERHGILEGLEGCDAAWKHGEVILFVISFGQIDDGSACLQNNSLRSEWVATTVPFPGSPRPKASTRQFIELAGTYRNRSRRLDRQALVLLDLCVACLGSAARSLRRSDLET